MDKPQAKKQDFSAVSSTAWKPPACGLFFNESGAPGIA